MSRGLHCVEDLLCNLALAVSELERHNECDSIFDRLIDSYSGVFDFFDSLSTFQTDRECDPEEVFKDHPHMRPASRCFVVDHRNILRWKMNFAQCLGAADQC